MVVHAGVLKRALGGSVMGLMLATPCVVTAHHSVSPYDRNSIVEIAGVVSGIVWRNPHVMFTLRVATAGGEEEWQIEGDSANAAARKGFTRDSMKIGDRVRIAGWPSIRGRKEIFVMNILMPNGVETVLTDLRAPLRWTTASAEASRAPADARLGRSLFRVWSSRELYRARGEFAYTPAAAAARASWNPLTDMPALHCIAPGMPNAMLNPYPIQFIDEGQRIRVAIEEWEAVRLIDMVARAVPAGARPSKLGYSIGRWEGGTLVVETSRVDFPYLDDEGTPMSGAAKIVERFTVSEAGNGLRYEISVTDPRNLLKPVIWDQERMWVPGVEVKPFECDLQ